MPHIDYYFVTISPWTYLAGLRLEEIAGKHGATITYKPCDINRVFASTGGLPLAERPKARRDYRVQELRRWRAALGMELVLEPAFFPTNPAPSGYAIIAAQGAGGGDLGKLTHSILRACWAEERDVADEAVIRSCLEGAGFDPGLANSGLLTGAMTYEANADEAINAGVFGAPFYIVDGKEMFWGQDRLEMLDRYLSGELA
ncbi:2-hydroxychromene-2-carboxylate isomerase [Pseudooceanicola batsensis]|uniref:2-hydroxychromene-2-carboxylate isomerase n=1 Tax=Pseudooceanicola batsensis TaxID=314255 RepID=UPI0002D42919|nr:2-hydroxychromene-2-carboxylate isomerase [Pseudooceanicola batsensis]